MTDRRVKEYIIGKDAAAEFVKTVQEWKFQKDWQKKGLIFNPETGASEDGTMSDCLFRPWINQPKKEQTMNREDIKNCPFCGSRYANKPEVMNYYNSYTGTQYFIRCTYCFATSRHTNSEKEAIVAWNRRTDND